MRYRWVLSLIFATCFLTLMETRLRAEHLIAPERIPQDAILVISVSDAPGMWSALKQSPLYSPLSKLMDLSVLKKNPGFQQFLVEKEGAEKRLGFSLDPDFLCRNVIKGADLAMRMRSSKVDDLDLLINVKLKDPKYGESILKELEAEAKREQEKQSATESKESDASGSAPKTEDLAAGLQEVAKKAVAEVTTVTHKEIAGVSVLVIPADGLWACQKGDLMLFASSGETMTSALKPTKGDFEKRPEIREGLVALGNPASSHVFYSINIDKVAEGMAQNPNYSAPQLDMVLERMKNVNIVGTLDAKPDHLEAHSYVPNIGDDPFTIKMATEYPPTQIRSLRLAPVHSWIAAAFNNFDGPKYLDKMMIEAGSMANASGGAGAQNDEVMRQVNAGNDEVMRQVNAGLAQFEQMMGFKLKDDFLASIGPEGVFTVENVQFNPLASPLPIVDLFFGFKIKNREKLGMVLSKLEGFLTQVLPGFLGMSGGPGNQQPPNIQMKPLTIPGVEGKVLSHPNFPQYSPGWAYVGDFIVFGSTENTLQRSAGAFIGQSESVLTSQKYRQAKNYLPPRANSEAKIGFQKIVNFVSNLAFMMGGNMDAEEQEAFTALMGFLKIFEESYVVASTNTKGQSVMDLVVMFDEASPSSSPSSSKPSASSSSGASTQQSTGSASSSSSGAEKSSSSQIPTNAPTSAP